MNNYSKYTPRTSTKDNLKNSGFGGCRNDDYLYRRSLSPDSRQDSPRGLNSNSRRGESTINKGFSRNTRERNERDYYSSKYSNSRNERDNERTTYLERNSSNR